MSPDDTFVTSRPYDELATAVIARGRRIRRRRALLQRALPAAALLVVVAFGLSASVGGDQSGLDVQVTDQQGEESGDPAESDREDESETSPGTASNYAPSRPAPSQRTADNGASPIGGSGDGRGPPTSDATSRAVAFTGTEDGRTVIYVADGDGSNARRVTTGPGNSFWPTWSSDGSRLAFYNDRDGTNRIYTVSAAGRDEALLVDLGSDHATQPAWSPVENIVAFTRFTRPVAQTSIGPTTPMGIWVVRSDGSGLRQLVADGAQAAWSPDGRELAYVDAEGLRVLDVGSGESRAVAASANVPRWSPDGRRLAFGRVVDNREQLFVIDSDGSDERRLVTSDAYDSLPEWSPDGESIVFTRDLDGRVGRVDCTSLESCGAGGAGPSGLWMVNASGGQPQPFVATTGRSDYHCRFSPRR